MAQTQVRVAAGRGLCGRFDAALSGLAGPEGGRHVADDQLLAFPTERGAKSNLILDDYLSFKMDNVCRVRVRLSLLIGVLASIGRKLVLGIFPMAEKRVIAQRPRT